MQSTGRAFFFVLALAAGVLLALAVFQVPQPWRAILVAWLLICATLGVLVVRLVRHHYEYKALQQRRGRASPVRVAPREPATPRFEGLKVVMSSEGGQRYTI
jgi:fatty acid desaturase